MELVLIEKKTFEAMLTRFEIFKQNVADLCLLYGEKRTEKWYDNQDACLILRVSLRTLQTLRDNGTLPYAQVNRKVYYRKADLEKLIKKTDR